MSHLHAPRMIAEILILILLSAEEVEPGCTSRSFTATTQLRLLEYLEYSNNDDCMIYISPSSSYRSGYYLEIKWVVFDIEGNLPECKDYIEVFLTRAKRSIGKYCSGNTGSETMFNMYSSDGYATLHFKSDNIITKRGFKFSYQLRSFTNNTLGEYGKGTCYYSTDTTYYGLFYSSGWPNGYTNGSGVCYHTVSLPKGKQARIAVMDLDLRKVKSTCDGGNDYFQMRVSNRLYNGLVNILLYSKSFTSRHCGTYHPGYWNTSDSHVYLLINKPFGSYPLYSNRGAVMAYLFYSIPNDDESSKPKKSFWAIIGGSVGGGVLLISSIVGMIIKKCKDGDSALCHFENNGTIKICCS